MVRSILLNRTNSKSFTEWCTQNGVEYLIDRDKVITTNEEVGLYDEITFRCGVKVWKMIKEHYNLKKEKVLVSD